ncbi:MAG: UDP-3-O-(3-hydroxymyristoyl)glucosamine N-acyltransferase, partial [Planctomycetes bacterium]|nr:UDP-3-O-(3-hydroxymyristoyl)glucosamine N-acyltransferase [Planctomycetota bacterium]
MSLSELAETIGGTLCGSDGGRIVRGAASIESAGPDEVTFLANSRYERYMTETAAAAVIVAQDYRGPGEALIRCGDPYFAFRQAMVALYGFRRAYFRGIDPRACVDESAELAEGVSVGPLAVIGPDVKIGPGTVIWPGAFIGPGCRIGRDCEIYPHVTLYAGTVLHDRVRIHAGTTIGQDGFGYATHAGRHHKIPEAGWVELEDDVEIGACCAIERATLGATVIGAGTKFADLVAIGHGTRLGKHCLMVSQSGIAGSTHVGDYCVFAAQSGVVGHIRIADGVQVGAQSGVTNDVPAGQQVLGSPAKPLGEAKRAMVISNHLPEMRRTLRKVVRELDELKRRLDELRPLPGSEPGE